MENPFPVTAPHRHWGCRVNDRIQWCGMRALILQNEQLQIVVLVDKGAEIIQFLYKPLDIDFLWRNRNDLHDPARFASAGGSDSAPFFDHWSGGWFEVVPNNGPGCEYGNVHLGFYAETFNIPWEYRVLEDTPRRIKVALWVKTYRMPFLLQKTLTLESGRPALQIEERLSNQGNEPLDFAWGHHPVLGPPFLDGNCHIDAAPCAVMVGSDEDGPGYRLQLHQTGKWPYARGVDGSEVDLRIVLPREAGNMDNCYLHDWKDAWIAVSNPALGAGFGLSWSPEVFRYLWLWQAYGGGAGYPWWSDAYQLGIEPWSSHPCAGLQTAIKNGSSLQLAAHSSMHSWLTAVAFPTQGQVVGIDRNGSVEQKTHEFTN